MNSLPDEAKEAILERCGYCGEYFIGGIYLSASELNETPKAKLENAPLGYCPNAEQEAREWERKL